MLLTNRALIRRSSPVIETFPSWHGVTNQWIQVPNGNISTRGVAPSPSPGGGGVAAVCDAWGGASVRHSSGHFILHGGGHGDYYGNEIYAIDLMAESPDWSRVWGPSSTIDTTASVYYNPDGTPKSDHTYYNNWYDPVNDRFMRVFTGDPPQGNNSRDLNSFNWGTSNWNVQDTHPDCPYGGYDGGKCSDPDTGDMYYWGNTSNAKWTRSTNTWTTTNQNNTQDGLNNATAFDSSRGVVWCVAGTGVPSGSVFKWTLGSGNVVNNSNTFSTVTVTGASSGITTSVSAGAFYLPETDRVYIYTGGGTIYVFNPNDNTIVSLSTTGTAPNSNSSYGNNTGTLGKFCYVKRIKGLVLKPAWNSPTFIMRLTT